MQPYQQRVVDELKELTVKIKALEAFVESDTFSSELVDVGEQILLVDQLDIMMEYASILEVRISNFK